MKRSYTKNTIKELYAKSGNQCSFPGCNIQLFENGNQSEICHISGLNPNSARYDKSMTDEERNSYANLILLCPTHHQIVDSDSDRFSIEVLQSMKNNHEESVCRNISANQHIIFKEKMQRIFSNYKFDEIINEQSFAMPFDETYITLLEAGCNELKQLLNNECADLLSQKSRQNISMLISNCENLLLAVGILYSSNGSGVALINNPSLDHSEQLEKLRQLMTNIRNVYNYLRGC